MILHLYSLKNRLSGIYERPVAEAYDPKEYMDALSQSLAVAEVPVLNFYKEFDVYCLGILDTKSGEISQTEVEFVGSCESVCLTFIAAKEKKNVQEVGESVGA